MLNYRKRTRKMKLSEMFWKCHCGVKYETVGDEVNYAFVGHGRTLYIYFQGSSEISDWIRNFLFKKRPYKDMGIPYRVHRGFLAAWKQVEDIVIAKITERVVTDNGTVFSDPEAAFTSDASPAVEYRWKKIVVVGYSHGGALAAFCHECVWFWRPDLRENRGLEGYGFEAPRIFGGFRVPAVLKERWATFTVIKTNNDIVVHCPPCFLRYCHVGEILQVHGDTSLVTRKIPKCVKSHFPEVVHDALLKYEEQ